MTDQIFKEKTYIEVWDGDLDRFVSEFYGRPWDFARVEESSNDVYHTLSVTKEEPDFFGDGEAESILQAWLNAPVPAPNDWRALSEFEGKYAPAAPIVFWDLCRRGVIPEGSYLIHVSW